MIEATQQQIDELHRAEAMLGGSRDVFKENDEHSERFRLSQEYGLNAYMDIEIHSDLITIRYLQVKLADGTWWAVFRRMHQWKINYKELEDRLVNVARIRGSFLDEIRFK